MAVPDLRDDDESFTNTATHSVLSVNLVMRNDDELEKTKYKN